MRQTEIVYCGSKAEELKLLTDWLRGHDLQTQTIGVCAHSTRQVEKIARHLQAEGLPVSVLEAKGEESAKPGVRVMTMHRSKGLEFDAVCLMHLGGTEFPPAFLRRPEAFPDAAAREDAMLRLRSLVHVAATQARSGLRVSASGSFAPEIFADACS